MVLTRRPRAGTPFGEKLAALMDARGLSVRETAQRVSCSAGYLSGVIQGRRRPSGRMTARLEDVLAAGGELAALAQAAGVATREDQNPPTPGGPVREAGLAPGGGFSLSLPYVPGRLVIEVSGPAAIPGLAPGENTAIAGGRLALVRDVTSGISGREVTGA
jgi:transcriptional regulator with XRE-family HTH domain